MSKTYVDPVKYFAVGDVIVNTWGYGQTNKDYHKVVGITKAFLITTPLQSKTVSGDFMVGKSMPTDELNLESRLHDVNKKRRVYLGYRDEPHVNFKYGSGTKWDGTPQNFTGYN